MKIQFTNHILYESALRTEDEEIKKDILKIKEYFEDMFHKMWDFWYLITYARKKDFDIIENKILRIIRNTKWKKKF